jgi:hypothetical protein
MSLLKRLLGDKSAAHPRPASSSDEEDSRSTIGPGTRSTPRRDVVHVVLRDTMRRHGIPGDWIECHTLSAAQPEKGSGTYVILIVKRGQDRLLGFVPAFQSSFLAELQSFDPRASDWMRGLSWQFDFSAGTAPMTGASGGAAEPATASAASAASTPAALIPAEPEDDLQADLQALFAIRDAALGETAPDTRAATPRRDRRDA